MSDHATRTAEKILVWERSCSARASEVLRRRIVHASLLTVLLSTAPATCSPGAARGQAKVRTVSDAPQPSAEPARVAAQPRARAQRYEVSDTHVHLTNYIQEGTPITKFLHVMGSTVGRAVL